MVALDDAGYDYRTISEFKLFCILRTDMTPDDTRLLFGDVDLSAFEPQVDESGNLRLFNRDTLAVIDEAAYRQAVAFIRKIHYIKYQRSVAGNDSTAQYMIDRQRRRMKYNRRNTKAEPVIAPLVSAMCNSAEFKYDMQTVWTLPIYAFFDSVRRIQKIRESQNISTGIYAGTIDGKKLPSGSLNWLGSLE